MSGPTFLLAPISLTEFTAFWAEQPSLFVAPASEPDPEKRALLVLQWYLSTLKPRYIGRRDKLGGKKPLNAFLGELFLGQWEDENGETKLVTEQVCYDPGVTAFNISNAAHGVSLQGYSSTVTSFSGSVDIKNHGHAVLHLDRYNESHIFTLPDFHVKGILTGPYPELDKDSWIWSSSGYTSHLSYAGKGWLSGKKNYVTATLYPSAQDEKKAIYNIKGVWTDKLTLTNQNTNQELSMANVDTAPITPLSVPPLEEQDPYESRRAWKPVTDALKAGNSSEAGRERSKLEDAQRKMRESERAKKMEWKPIFFSKLDEGGKGDEAVEVVRGMKGFVLDEGKTNGVWRFDAARAAEARRPYHGDVGPAG